jgi:hypothetical protein
VWFFSSEGAPQEQLPRPREPRQPGARPRKLMGFCRLSAVKVGAALKRAWF